MVLQAIKIDSEANCAAVTGNEDCAERYTPINSTVRIENRNTIVVKPREALAYNTSYRILVSESARTSDGAPVVEKSWTSRFKTKKTSQYAIALPEPKGPFGVGESPLIPFVVDAQASPAVEANLQVWYPVNKVFHGERAYYFDQQISEMAVSAGTTTASLADIVQTNAQLGMQGRCETRHPVILFSPGFGGMAQIYHRLIETWVSYGFVVVGINHPEVSAVVRRQDGTIISGLPMPFELPDDQQLAWFQSRVDPTVRDLNKALDHLQQMDQSDTFIRGCSDFRRVAAIGHSFGGSSAMEWLAQSPRVQAAVNLDGTMFGASTALPISKPFMLIQSDHVADEWFSKRFNAAFGTKAFWVGFKSTQHNDFSDAPLIKPWMADQSDISALPSQQSADLINTWVLAFFREAGLWDNHGWTPMPVDTLDRSGISAYSVKY